MSVIFSEIPRHTSGCGTSVLGLVPISSHRLLKKCHPIGCAVTHFCYHQRPFKKEMFLCACEVTPGTLQGLPQVWFSGSLLMVFGGIMLRQGSNSELNKQSEHSSLPCSFFNPRRPKVKQSEWGGCNGCPAQLVLQPCFV